MIGTRCVRWWALSAAMVCAASAWSDVWTFDGGSLLSDGGLELDGSPNALTPVGDLGYVYERSGATGEPLGVRLSDLIADPQSPAFTVAFLFERVGEAEPASALPLLGFGSRQLFASGTEVFADVQASRFSGLPPDVQAFSMSVANGRFLASINGYEPRSLPRETGLALIASGFVRLLPNPPMALTNRTTRIYGVFGSEEGANLEALKTLSNPASEFWRERRSVASANARTQPWLLLPKTLYLSADAPFELNLSGVYSEPVGTPSFDSRLVSSISEDLVVPSPGVWNLTIEPPTSFVGTRDAAQIRLVARQDEPREAAVLLIGDSIFADRTVGAALRRFGRVDRTLVSRVDDRTATQGGWTVDRFVASEDSPFVFDGQLDVARYRVESAREADFGWIFVHLGINDVFQLTSVDEVDLAWQTTGPNLAALVEGLLEAWPESNVGICLPIMPAASGADFEAVFGQDRGDYVERLKRRTRQLLEAFDGTSERVGIVPLNGALDPVADFPRRLTAGALGTIDPSVSDPIHPTRTGDVAIARMLYAWMVGFGED